LLAFYPPQYYNSKALVWESGGGDLDGSVGGATGGSGIVEW